MTQPYRPTPIVQVALGYGPYDEVPDDDDWVDISADVYEVTVQRGRSSEFEAFPASTATVALYNDDRVYDPVNLDGPHVATVPNGKAPYVVATATKSGTSLGSNNAMNMPAGIVAGELLVAIMSECVASSTVTASAGWTQVRQLRAGDRVTTAAFAKIAVGSDTLSLSGDAEDYACVVARVASHGVAAVGTDVLWASATSLNSAAIAAATITVPEPRRYLGIFATGCDATFFVEPWPSGGTIVTEIISGVPAPDATMLLAFSRDVFETGAPVSFAPGSFAIGGSMFAAKISILIPGPTEPRTLLQPNVPIRVLADVPDASVIPVWRGVVDGWPGTYSEGGYRNEVEVACTDVFKVLAERPLPDTLARDVEALTLPPVNWFRGDLSPGGQLVDRYGRSKDGALVTPVSVGDPLTLPGSRSLRFSSTQAGAENRNVELPIARIGPGTTGDDLLSGTSWAWSALFQAAGGGASGSSVKLVASIAATQEVIIHVTVSDAGVVTAFVNGVGANLTATPAPGISSSDRPVNLLDGKPHHVFVLRVATSLAVWVDGKLLASTSNGSATGYFDMTGATIALGRAVDGSPDFAMSDVMFWAATTFPTGNIPTLNHALKVGFSAPRPTGQAINDVLDLIGWPASLRAIDDGEMTVQPPGNPNGLVVLDTLQRLADSEQGRLFVDAEGKVTFHGRRRTQAEASENTVQYTFSDDTSTDVGTRDGTLQITLDDRFTFDSAKVTRVDGVEQTASPVVKPVRTRSLDGLYLTDDRQALAIAEWIVYRYGQPLVRTEAWGVDPETKPDDWPDILALEVGHRVRHDVTPGGLGSPLTLDQSVELIEHDISTEQWLITMNGSPVDNSDYFLWDTSESTDYVHGWDAGVWG